MGKSQGHIAHSSAVMASDVTCSTEALDAICQKVDSATARGCKALAVVVLPGSLNPVHSEHLRTLDLVRCHLECQGIAVVAGFLQPSSDAYVMGKLGPEWAMRLEDRITACELAAEENARGHDCEKWIHAWRSGQTNGFFVPSTVEKFLNAAVPNQRGAHLELPITAYMVCGADLVQRCGGWRHPAPSPVVVLARPGIELPATKPCEGWEVADGEMKPISSTRIRDAIASGQWNTLIEEGCSSAVVEFMRARHERKTLFMA